MALRKLLVALTFIVYAAGAQCADWPAKPIRWIVPYSAGGGTDLMARVLAGHLEKTLGQRIVVENRPGGSTVTGTAALAQADPDGYTVGMVFDSLAINAVLGTVTPYDPEKDFTPIINLAYVPLMFIVNPKEVPMKTLPELVAYAKANPDWLTFGSLGPGSPHEIGFEWFRTLAGIKATVVPYKGVNPAMQDTLAGRIKSTFIGVAVADQYLQAGTLRALGVTTAKRLASAPNLPTIAEQGYPGYDFVTFYGLAAPKNTPQPIVDRLNKEINGALNDPDVRKRLEPLGAILAGGSSKEFGEYLAANMARFKKIMTPQ